MKRARRVTPVAASLFLSNAFRKFFSLIIQKGTVGD